MRKWHCPPRCELELALQHSVLANRYELAGRDRVAPFSFLWHTNEHHVFLLDLGIIGDMIRFARGMFQALRAYSKLRKVSSSADSKAADTGSPSSTTPVPDINTVRESIGENFVGIVKTSCDTVRNHRQFCRFDQVETIFANRL